VAELVRSIRENNVKKPESQPTKKILPRELKKAVPPFYKEIIVFAW
jgi:hypothetical protein